VATVNGGASWRFVETPKVSLGKAVSSVQVANGLDGWLYGPGLWSTHDGGARWRKLSLPGAVVQMADSAGTVYAVVEPDPATDSPWELFRSPVGRDAWTRAGHITSDPNPAGDGLAVFGRAVWFGHGAHLWSTANGRALAQIRVPLHGD
jgi:hypothetical protein